jgi:DDE superfamily endonuclease
MEPHHETNFPTSLSRWLREIVLSVPEAARTTIAELIIGALLAGGGHVTQAFLALTPRLGWQAYHWMIEHGRFRLLGLITALCGIIRREVAGRCFAIIDDTLAPRSSAKAPGAAVRFDHAAKTNRPTFLLCQSFVTLSAVVPCRDRPRAVPVVSDLCRGVGNAGKLAIAKGLLRAVGDRLGPLYLLLDAWYMRGALIRAALRLGHDIIGQVRRDTALFRLPAPRRPGRRGRRRLYGEKICSETVAGLPVSIHRIAGGACSRENGRRTTGPPASPRLPPAVPARCHRAGGLVRVGETRRLGQTTSAAVHRSGAVRPGHRRGLLHSVECRASVQRS